MRLENKVALITGAAHGVTGEVKGFGGVAARMFAEEGAKVVLTDIDTDSGERTAAELKAERHDVMFVKLDVTSESDWGERDRSDRLGLWRAGHTGQQRGHRRRVAGSRIPPRKPGTSRWTFTPRASFSARATPYP